MIDFLRWLLAIEVIGLAFLPITTWFLRALPDRGYAFARVLGLLLVTFVAWWIGSVAPLANNIVILWALVLAGAVAWAPTWRTALAGLRPMWRTVVVEEALFVGGLALWAWVRGFDPAILNTEKPMDMMLLQATGHASSFPPPDLWLSGFTVNYYYFGYLMMSTLGHIAGTAPAVTFNLSLALVFALGISGSYSLAYNLTRRRSWALCGPVMIMLLGHAHAFFFQLLDGKLPWNQQWWFWESSRIVGETSPGTANTINEFPMFSFVLGDLHPHVLAIPVALLALAVALAFNVEDSTFNVQRSTRSKARRRAFLHRLPAFAASWSMDRDMAAAGAITPDRHKPILGTWNGRIQYAPTERGTRLLLAAVVVGSLFAINSWDYPTYLLVIVAAVIAGAARQARRRGSERAVVQDAEPSAMQEKQRVAATPSARSRFKVQGSTSGTQGVPGRNSAENQAAISQRPGCTSTRSLPVSIGWWTGAPSRRVWLGAAGAVALLVVASLLLYAPFYLHYHSPTHGLGTVTGRTNVGQFAQVFGFFGIAVLALVATLGWRQGLLRTAILAVRSPSPEAGALSQPHEGGETLVLALVLVAAVALAAVLHAWVLLLSLGTALLALYLLGERAPRLRRADVYALLLVTLSGIIVAGTEVVYLRDSFDGSAMYRMNTVFKFYYQVWILLGLVAAYAAWRVFDVLRHRSRALVGIWLVALVAGIGIGGTYTVLGPISFYGAQGGGPVDFQQSGLDGMTWMQQGDPLDYAAITWLQRHVHGNPTVLEATGGEYSDFARVSTFAGLPTLLGWQGHEAQWRGNVPELQIRHTVIDQIYSTGDARVAARLIHEYHVSLVYVGTCEQGVYVHGPASTTDVCGSSGTPTVPSAANALSKFGTFMHVIYNRDGVSIYHV